MKKTRNSTLMHLSALCACYFKGGVHISFIKCKGVQLTKINWQELSNVITNVEEHPAIEPIYQILSYIFQYSALLHFFRKWVSFYQLIVLLNTHTHTPYIYYGNYVPPFVKEFQCLLRQNKFHRTDVARTNVAWTTVTMTVVYFNILYY